MVEKRNLIQGGYSKLPFFINTTFNSLLSLVLIVFSLPLMVIIALIVKIKDGGPILYKGVRLGINKTPFIMYKFRTLSKDADKIIGAELLTAEIASTKKLMTPFGKFLRETRLDELPQLFNVLKGDMDFLGPRPERPEIYERFCKCIEGYDERFSVKPGLIGYSQLFTPHSAPKRIRTLIDNKFLKKKQNLLWDMGGVVITILAVLKRIFYHGSKIIWGNIIKIKIFGLYREKRYLERIKQHEAVVYIGTKKNDKEIFTDEAKLVDINEEAILIYSNSELNRENLLLKMEMPFKRMFKERKRKTAICDGSVYKKIKLKNEEYKYAYVIKYTPISPLNYYMVRQYFLQESII
jgi:lipopolysaccharide/colanic/teichoic acid biosynthesis glycosyltransferase